ncbi:MAG: hypothetical protein KJ666_07335, partial [Bacteroidetes bacterium]|nr:hypothetical protein [Bacteroidota bacterium]
KPQQVLLGNSTHVLPARLIVSREAGGKDVTITPTFRSGIKIPSGLRKGFSPFHEMVNLNPIK